jgi:hypothetical protein
LPVWRTTYKRGSKLAVTSLILSSSTALACYARAEGEGRFGFLIISGLSFAVIPYTVLFMKPTNDALFATTDKAANDEITALVSKWAKLQWVRTGLGLAAFILTVYTV